MKKKYQNAFFIFGIIVLALMASQLDFAATWNSLKHAGYWFLAVVALWLFLYIFNTASWYLIINSQYNENNQQESSNKQAPIKFWWLYKITISGFALNYATPEESRIALWNYPQELVQNALHPRLFYMS